jgi:hypothetical protein
MQRNAVGGLGIVERKTIRLELSGETREVTRQRLAY